MASFCVANKHDDAIDKKKIQEMASKCTKLVKELDVKGVRAFIPSKPEVIESFKELRSLLRILKITDKEEKKEELEAQPHMSFILSKLRAIKGLEKLSLAKIEEELSKDEPLLEMVVKYSMLDNENRLSPIYKMDIGPLLGDCGCNLKRKQFERNEETLKLIYSTVIPPGKRKIPDITKFTYKDPKGRTCYCSC